MGKRKEFTPFWRFTPVALADGARRAELLVEGMISSQDYSEYGIESVTAQQFRQELTALKLGADDELTIRVNSGGGEVFPAMAIANEIKRCSARTVAVVESVAASAATIITCACDTVQMYPGTMMLLHCAADYPPYRMNAAAHEKAAAELRKFDAALVALYMQRTGKSEEEIRRQMDTEAYLSAAECLAFGIADVILDGEPVTAVAQAEHPDVWEIGGRLFDFSGVAVRPVAMLGEAPAAAGAADPLPCPLPEGREMAALVIDSVEGLAAAYPELVAAVRAAAFAAGKAERDGVTPVITVAGETTQVMMGEVVFYTQAHTDAAVAEERRRVQAVLALAEPGAEAIITAAIAEGREAGAVATAILAASRERRLLLEEHGKRVADAAASGVQQVAAGVAPTGREACRVSADAFEDWPYRRTR